MLTKITAFIKEETVLCIAAACALASMCAVPPSAAYLGYVDLRVLCLLFCLMAVVAGFHKCGVFTALAQRLLAGQKRMRLISAVLILLPFFCSMFMTNDVALLTFVPFAVLVLRMIGREKHTIRIVVLQTVAANLGSMMTPVGNPQNLFLYEKYHIPAGAFFSVVFPLACVSLIGVFLGAMCMRRETIYVRFSEQPQPPADQKLLWILTGLFLLCLLSVFHLLHHYALTAAVIICLLRFDRTLLRHVDYGLLATFVFFFIFAGNIGQIPAIRLFLESIMSASALYASAIASQIISNVPAAVLLSGFTEDWRALLAGVNIGGLGTPIASLASLISLKLYMKTTDANLLRYLAVFTLVNFAGFAFLLFWAAFFMGLGPFPGMPY